MTGPNNPGPPGPWPDAVCAALLFAVDPVGTGGVVLRAGPGPVRERWLALLRQALPRESPVLKVGPTIDDGRLLGGLDLAATLRTGRPVAERGVLAAADGGVVLLSMAERMSRATAARLTSCIDTGAVMLARDGFVSGSAARIGCVALDEGMTAEETPPPALLDRLAFHIDLGPVGWREVRPDTQPPEAAIPKTVEWARARLRSVEASAEMLEALCGAAAVLGIDSLRAPLRALAAARAAAAVAGRLQVSSEDTALAARLVLAPRATALPGTETAAEDTGPEDTGAEDRAEDTETGPSRPTDASPSQDTEPAPEPSAADLRDMLVSAAQAAIPAGLLAALTAGSGGRPKTLAEGRAGVEKAGGARGRPAGVGPGQPRGGLRLSVIDTLRAAAPWQSLRRQEAGASGRLAIRREDFRVLRTTQRSATTMIFVVDASGSAALNRLAEAKGAVELLLAECYVRRDQVALVAFRGRGAQLLLPPTRSLARAKRSLSSLPGGGGTPLAAGLDAGLALADGVRRRGGTPNLLLLTDGRANVARDGKGSRTVAEQEATAAAGRIRAAGIAAMLIDVSPRPHPGGQRLAAAMNARYLPLPYAGAAALSQAVRAASAPRSP